MSTINATGVISSTAAGSSSTIRSANRRGPDACASTPTPTPAPTPTPTPAPAPLDTVVSVGEVTGKKHLVTEIVVDLSGPVNAAQAENIATYRLATANGKGSFTARNSHVMAVLVRAVLSRLDLGGVLSSSRSTGRPTARSYVALTGRSRDG